MKEEDKILQKYGKKNPFLVPEGYFENFTERLMDRLPEKEVEPEPTITLWQRVKPWIYMTAMFCGLMFSFKVLTEKPDKEDSSILNSYISEFSDEDIKLLVDNCMTDDYTLYTYITESDNNLTYNK